MSGLGPDIIYERDELIAAVKAIVRVIREEVDPRRDAADVWTATKATMMRDRLIETCHGMSARIEEIDATLAKRGDYAPPDEARVSTSEVLYFTDYRDTARDEFAK